MSSGSSHRPVLLVHPDRSEAADLRDRLTAQGVSQPIVISPSVDDARDYLLAAALAQPLDPRYVPCLTLLDENLGDVDIRAFAQWISEQPGLAPLRVIRLTDDERTAEVDDGRWGDFDVVGTHDRLQSLRAQISRACGD